MIPFAVFGSASLALWLHLRGRPEPAPESKKRPVNRSPYSPKVVESRTQFFRAAVRSARWARGELVDDLELHSLAEWSPIAILGCFPSRTIGGVSLFGELLDCSKSAVPTVGDLGQRPGCFGEALLADLVVDLASLAPSVDQSDSL